MSKSGGGGGRTSGRDRSEKPGKTDNNPLGKLAKAPPISVNAEAASEANREMKAAKRARTPTA